MSLSQQSATMDPNTEVEILFEISVPEGIRGTYWAGLLIDVRPIRHVVGRDDIRILRQFLVRCLVTIEPSSAVGVISSVQVRGVHPLGVEVVFSNVGDVMLSEVSGLVVVESSTGVPLSEIPLPPFDVLPGYAVSQLVSGDWGLQIPGAYLIRAVVDFGAEYLVAGHSVLRLRELELAPVGIAVLPPTDLDNDGLYEDLDGNGFLDRADVDLLKAYVDLPAVQTNWRAFDFDNDGAATEADADFLAGFVLRIAD
jgi:hypothetical protein